jgi:predicted permease
LIATINAASLLAARATTQSREFAVRSALGAARARLVSQSLAESLCLAVPGGLLGVGLAAGLLSLLPAVLPARLAAVRLEQVGLDVRVLLVATAMTMIAGLLAGLLPAWRAMTPRLTASLRRDTRTGESVRPALRAALVIGEVGLAALTLVGAGLTVRSFGALLDQPLGFESADRLTFSVYVPRTRYDTADRQAAALAEIEQRVGALPGVAAHGGVDLLPLGGDNIRRSLVIEGREQHEGDPPTRIHPVTATPGYFEAMRIPVVAGRGFSGADRASSEPVAVLSALAARVYFPGGDAIGRRLAIGGDPTWRTVVGVAGDVRHWGLQESVNPMVYLPAAQAGEGELTFVLRVEPGLEPESLAAPVRAAVREFDPALPVANLRTMQDVADASVVDERAQALLMTAFSLVALALAAIGIYGVTTRVVASRAREIGVRMALGARPGRIWREVMVENAWHVGVGLAMGVTAGVLLMRAAGAVLYAVAPWDPLTLAGVCLSLGVAAVLAAALPARRAMAMNPLRAMREG